MIKKLAEGLSAKGNLVNGLLALMIISLIVLGCTCNEKDGFNWGKEDGDTSSTNTARDESTGDKDEKADDEPFEADEDEVPTTAQSENLVKTTLMRFNEAVQAGDFADFHKTVSSTWRRRSKPADFNKGFKEFIDKEIDISRIRGEDPEFSPKPYIDKKYGKKVLFLKGSYETEPLPVNFNLEFIVDDDEWKLVFIGVDTRSKD
ncbi:MAG: hypothetical protein OEM82_10795 [Acidobacteriota bacterium]|nr:hypothetical protein [Acidobacteriota bacterium]MDH3529701.1 hypothetical protein [Acidobacteriota bacterium]